MDNSGHNFFHQTVINGKNNVLDVFLSHERIDPNILTVPKKHVLNLATSRGTLDLLLNNANIDINVMDDHGPTFFHRTVMNGSSEVLKVLMSHERINPKIETGTKNHDLLTLLLDRLTVKAEVGVSGDGDMVNHCYD